jgi:hypothetical protein
MRMMIIKTIAVASLLLFVIVAASPTVTTTGTGTTIFQSVVDGIRVQVPSDWFAEDLDNTEVIVQRSGVKTGSELLVILCPQSETLPKIGGGFVCPMGADNQVWIERHSDLKSRPEFGVLTRENKSITISGFLAYDVAKRTLY